MRWRRFALFFFFSFRDTFFELFPLESIAELCGEPGLIEKDITSGFGSALDGFFGLAVVVVVVNLDFFALFKVLRLDLAPLLELFDDLLLELFGFVVVVVAMESGLSFEFGFTLLVDLRVVLGRGLGFGLVLVIVLAIVFLDFFLESSFGFFT